jgi:hypothetical protein
MEYCSKLYLPAIGHGNGAGGFTERNETSYFEISIMQHFYDLISNKSLREKP